jgi:ubiquinone/menaquinone biosynthesis C-methylase UbiE
MTQPFAARHYGERAHDYVASAVHSQGQDLDLIERSVAGRGLGRVLDLGCGGGHVSYRLAPHVREVVACDITPAMLEAVAQEAGRRGQSNISTVLAPAENLPFAAGTFDAVFCRFTTHHWADALAGLVQARRVLSPEGMAVFIDVTAPPVALFDSWLQTLELLRDPSHVRDYSMAEWTAMLGQAGFAVRSMQTHRLPMAFESWVARTKTSAPCVAAIRALQQNAPDDVTRFFEMAADGSFTLDVGCFEVTAL